MKSIRCFIILATIFMVTMLLTGCPQKITNDEIVSGDMYKDAISSVLYARYKINFSTEDTPTETIKYKADEETLATAVFQLDGYDAEKKIGYKLITKTDKAEWEQEIKNGNMEVPNVQCYRQIQTAAIEYEYPIIFIDISDYQTDTDEESLVRNNKNFFDEVDNLLNTSAMEQWLDEHGE